MAEDYISFDEALKALRMEEAELRALVSQGKLRAFRDENTLKFRRQDIENLAAAFDNKRCGLLPVLQHVHPCA